jgi:hypothetical protein
MVKRCVVYVARKGEEIADREVAGKGKEWNLISVFFIAGKEPRIRNGSSASSSQRSSTPVILCPPQTVLTFAFKSKNFVCSCNCKQLILVLMHE